MWIVHCVRPFKTNRPVGRFYYASMLVRCFSSDNSHRVLPRYVKSFAPSVRSFMPFFGLVWSRNLLAAMDNVAVFPFGKIMIKLHRTRIGFSGLFSSSGLARTKTRRRKLKKSTYSFHFQTSHTTY